MLNENAKKIVEEIRGQVADVIPNGVCVHARTETPLGIESVLEAIKDLGEDKDFVIKTILAVYVSTFFEKKDPIWLMLIGNPSSNKTTLVDLLAGLEDVYRLDTMTANPFSSGQKEKDKPQDLLPLLDNKCFVIKEYGAFLGRSDEMVKQLISDLVAIYDGEYAKHSPTRGTVRYKTYFSHIGCVTPMALNKRQGYMNAVGPRFLYLKIPSLNEEQRKKSMEMIWQNGGLKSKEEISKIVEGFCWQAKERIENEGKPIFSDWAIAQINNFAELTCRARGITINEAVSFKGDDGNDKTHYEMVEQQTEEPFRALKQFKKLAESLAIVNCNAEVSEDEIRIVRLVALSSMPVRRAEILQVFEKGESFTAKQASEELKKNYKTVKRIFDELVSLEVLESKKGENDLARIYQLVPKFKGMFQPEQLTIEEVKQIFN